MSNIKQYPMPITKKLEITKYPDPCWVKSNLERIERLAVQANCTQDNAQRLRNSFAYNSLNLVRVVEIGQMRTPCHSRRIIFNDCPILEFDKC